SGNNNDEIHLLMSVTAGNLICCGGVKSAAGNSFIVTARAWPGNPPSEQAIDFVINSAKAFAIAWTAIEVIPEGTRVISAPRCFYRDGFSAVRLCRLYGASRRRAANAGR
ncbi:MAG: hypothetical protein WBP38_12655, partial [Hyphomicrobium sp.]